jgi:hypothetical protein
MIEILESNKDIEIENEKNEDIRKSIYSHLKFFI